MNSTEKIKKILYDVVGSILGTSVSEQNEQAMLHSIMNNSRQAILYVSLVEDEFEIEIDDEYINLDFFSSFDYVVGIIRKYISSIP